MLSSKSPVVETYMWWSIKIEVEKVEQEFKLKNSNFNAEKETKYLPSIKEHPDQNNGRNQVDKFCVIVSQLLAGDAGDSCKKTRQE